MEAVVLARIALARLGLVGKGEERDRRPTQGELDRLVAAFEANPRQQIPLGRIVRFAVATAMRQEEICRIEWADFEPENKMLLVWDRKDPRRKSGNNQRIPLLDVCGYDACAIVNEQRSYWKELRTNFSLQWQISGHGLLSTVPRIENPRPSLS
jgi:hypothetical protein